MKIAIGAAGFTPAEADKLRRAMATFKRVGTIGTFQRKMIDGMLANGISADVATRIFNQINGFADYGFPESHAYSFAYLVYASAWLKVHHPAAFYAGLLAAQPPASTVRRSSPCFTVKVGCAPRSGRSRFAADRVARSMR